MFDLEKEFCCAKEGRLVWHKIKNKYSFTNMFGLVIFPMTDMNINKEAVALLPDYKEQMFLQKIVVVTNQEAVICELKAAAYENICYELVSDEQMRQLLMYYRLVYFCAHIVVVSLEEPLGNTLLLRNERVNLKTYILSAIYKVR